MTVKHRLNLISPYNSERVITLVQSETIEFLVKLFHIKLKTVVDSWIGDDDFLLRYEGNGMTITSYKANKSEALEEILFAIGGGVC